METLALLNLMWDTGSADSIASMHEQARSIVMTALLGDEQLQRQFSYIGPALAQALLPTLTRHTIHRFLQTKTDYAVDVRPQHRVSWNATPTVTRYVKWQADLIDLRNMHFTGYPYALTIIDTFSKYAWAFPMTDKSGIQTARLFDTLFARQPLLNSATSQFKPALLLTDQGSEFRSILTRSVCRHHRVFQLFTLPYKPLGIIERFNQTLKRKMRRAVAKRRLTSENLSAILPHLLREYNATVHSTTKFRPIVLHFTVQQPSTQRILTEALQNTDSMRQRAERRVRNNLAPLAVGTHVRTTSMKDPHRSTKQRQKLRQQMEYKRFGHSYWTRHHFTVHSVDARGNYTLAGHAREKYRREQLQPVIHERPRQQQIIN
jgi:transposase InsO family protein